MFIGRLAVAAALTTLVAPKHSTQWQRRFDVDRAGLRSLGKNPFFVLTPGHRLELKGGDTKLVVTVLHQTEVVDGVQTRVVEEREWQKGKLIEVSRNFFAIDPQTNDVYYFGEDVDMYRNGKIVNHDGAWRSGQKGATFGLMMPGAPKKNQAYYQEIAPRVAMDRAKVVSTTAMLKTWAGTFRNCLKTEETTPLEPGEKSYKLYARGIGMIQDSDLQLFKLPE